MTIKPGSVRHKDHEGDDWMVTGPGDAMYSTALMLAQEVFVGDDVGWLPISHRSEYPKEKKD